MRRWVAVVLTLGLLLSGCGGGNDKGQNFSYDLAAGVTSLDPQFASGAGSLLVIQNCFEGLLRYDAEGNVVNGVAEVYNVSADGLTYTFTLSAQAKWSDGEPVTADDFLFAFERIFSPTTPSPYASDFLSIANAAEVLSGAMPVSSLGVRTGSDRQLVITLGEPNAFFAALLCSSAVSPCRRDFFAEQRGRYGLSTDTLLVNGPFRPTRWDSTQIVLRASDTYHSPVAVESVTLSVRGDDRTERFADGTTDFFLGEEIGDTFGTGYSAVSYYDRSYLLIFNQREAPYDHYEVRKALVSALDMRAIEGRLLPGTLPATGIVSPAASLPTSGYRDLVGSPDKPQLAADARELLFEAYVELGLSGLPPTDLLLTEVVDIPIGSLMQQAWQQQLSVYIDMRPVEVSNVSSEVGRGRYTLAIVPTSGVDASPYGILQAMAGREGDNLIGALYPDFEELIAGALAATSPREAARYYLAAEALLLEDFAVWPLYHMASNFISAPGVTGAYYLPQNGIIYFRDAARN